MENASFGQSTMSCFLCGKHRPRQNLQSRKFIGKSQAVCQCEVFALTGTEEKLCAMAQGTIARLPDKSEIT